MRAKNMLAAHAFVTFLGDGAVGLYAYSPRSVGSLQLDHRRVERSVPFRHHSRHVERRHSRICIRGVSAHLAAITPSLIVGFAERIKFSSRKPGSWCYG